jgi:WD40 repeat protein
MIEELDALGAAAIASELNRKLKEAEERNVPVSQVLFDLTHPLAGFMIRQAPKEAAPDATMYSGGFLPGDRVACLDDKGNLFWMVGGEQQHNVRLGIKQPCGLLEIEKDQLLAIDRSGELVNIQIGEDGVFTATERARTAKQISAVALNSYRSALAYVPADGLGVRGFFLANKLELELPDLEGLAPALVFSSDSALLAVGDMEGTLHVIDIPTREVVGSLTPSQKSTVQAVYAGPENTWIAVHQDQVILWENSKEAHVAALSEPATCSAARSDPMGWDVSITGNADVLAAFEIRNLLALGSASGNVSTYILDKGLQPHEQYKAHDRPLSALQFTPDSKQLICVGEGVSLRSLLIR